MIKICLKFVPNTRLYQKSKNYSMTTKKAKDFYGKTICVLKKVDINHDIHHNSSELCGCAVIAQMLPFISINIF